MALTSIYWERIRERPEFWDLEPAEQSRIEEIVRASHPDRNTTGSEAREEVRRAVSQARTTRTTSDISKALGVVARAGVSHDDPVWDELFEALMDDARRRRASSIPLSDLDSQSGTEALEGHVPRVAETGVGGTIHDGLAALGVDAEHEAGTDATAPSRRTLRLLNLPRKIRGRHGMTVRP